MFEYDKDAQSEAIGSIVYILFAIIVFSIIAIIGIQTHTPQLPKPETTITVDIYKYYTVNWYNGTIDNVLVDSDYYPGVFCDAIDNTNDDGHTCYLAHDNAVVFLDSVQYGINPYISNSP